MNNIEKVKELVEAELVREVEGHKNYDYQYMARRANMGQEEYIAGMIRSAKEKSVEVQTAYENRDSAISWAEDILAQFNFTLYSVGRYSVVYARPKGIHTTRMIINLNYGRDLLGRPADASFHVNTDKTNRHYAIKNNFAKQIGRRIEERDSIEQHFAGLKSDAYQNQAEVKAAFEKAKAAADDPSTSLKSEINHNDRHVFSMDFAGRDVPLHYVSTDYDVFDKGSLLVKVAFSAGGSESRIEKTMLLQEFLESELVYLIYFNDALASAQIIEGEEAK